MSVLLIGGDKISKLEALLRSLGATKTTHWDSRRNSTSHKSIPVNTDVVIMLTDFLKHNSMSYFKKSAKKLDIPYLCVRRGSNSIATEFTTFIDKKEN